MSDLLDVQELPLVLRLLRRIRPREGWAILILAWLAVCCLPGVAIEAAVLRGLGPTLWLATLGVLAAWWLAHRRVGGWLAFLVLALTGVAADLGWGVKVLNIWPVFGQIGRWVAWALSCGVRSRCPVPPPPVPYFGEQWQALAQFGQRVGWWARGALTGQGVADNLVLIGLAGLVAWSVAAWAGWWIARRGEPFVALLPTGVLIILQVYFADSGHGWLLAFLGLAAMLLVLARYHRLTQSWEQSGTDYSPEIILETVGSAIAIAGLVLVLAPTASLLLNPRQISEFFWRRFEEPYRQVEERLEQSFPGVQGVRSLIPPTGVAAGGLPRAHLLGGRPELGRQVALRVWPKMAADIGNDNLPSLYWRGQTFARYTGRGWAEDEAAQQPGGQAARLVRNLAAGEPWTDAVPIAGRRPVLSAVEVVEGSRAVLYAAGEPVSADRPYQAIQRAPGELIALSSSDRPQRYNVLGQVAIHDPNLLRRAADGYPPQVVELYLGLPPDLPTGLTAYVRAVTAGAQTPYDRALAIEAALRGLPYTLDVPVPPTDRELVAWFLFDLQRGYCDYFATAMAVLARLSGIPSRLAVGYATGTLDENSGAYVVTEMQAHSWPELYFPGYGWIPFEPTPSLPLGERLAVADYNLPDRPLPSGPEDLHSGLAELRQIAAANATAAERLTWLRRFLALLSVLLAWWTLGTLIGPRSERRTWVTGGEAGAWYIRLARWGGRLGRPLRDTDTPREYALALTGSARDLAARARVARRSAKAAADRVGLDASAVAIAVEQALYARADGAWTHRSARAWQRLWSALRRLWLARWRL